MHVIYLGKYVYICTRVSFVYVGANVLTVGTLCLYNVRGTGWDAVAARDCLAGCREGLERD